MYLRNVFNMQFVIVCRVCVQRPFKKIVPLWFCSQRALDYSKKPDPDFWKKRFQFFWCLFCFGFFELRNFSSTVVDRRSQLKPPTLTRTSRRSEPKKDVVWWSQQQNSSRFCSRELTCLSSWRETVPCDITSTPPASTQTRSDIMGAPLQAVRVVNRSQAEQQISAERTWDLLQVLFTVTQLTVSGELGDCVHELGSFSPTISGTGKLHSANWSNSCWQNTETRRHQTLTFGELTVMS